MEKVIDSKFSSLTKQELQMNKNQLYNYINSKKSETTSLNNKVSEINTSIKYCNDLVQKLKTASSNTSTSKAELEKYFQVNNKIANSKELNSIISQTESMISNINNNIVPMLKNKLNDLKNNINTNSSHLSLLSEYYNTLE